DRRAFYAEIPIPGFIPPGGIAIKVGKFYSLIGRDVYPAADTDFYSRTYENILAPPFTHTGGLITLHATPTWDIVAGVVVGWDVFIDNNNMASFPSSVHFNSPDQKDKLATTVNNRPEQPNNQPDHRSLVSRPPAGKAEHQE